MREFTVDGSQLHPEHSTLRNQDHGDDKRISYAPSGTCYIANIPAANSSRTLPSSLEKSRVRQIIYVSSRRNNLMYGGANRISFWLTTSGEGPSRGVEFIQFKSVGDAEIFVEHAQKTGNVRRRVEPSDTLMVPEFQGTSEAEVQPMFGSYVDDILAARFDKKEQSRNIFIQFRGVDIATEAMEAFRSQNEDIQIRYARQRNPQPTRTVLHLDYRNSGLNRCDIGF
ncbi:hypothetical protein L210DRAFT_3761412 [Boletus edulis BED1]|uniref:RRM domain-containing protein n=1 Tax=Boletus edulis BED1 TaxID=1328754 RepID=A0AAD4BS57_BOLED|nr:hypothetical protein L210DRAFT_3761412 [Boletus edulis BED1]